MWDACESAYVHDCQLLFFDHFSRYYAKVVRHNMLKCTRIKAGFGNPPRVYTTNSCESINAILERKVNYKETEWPEFNQVLKRIVDEQRKAVTGCASNINIFRWTFSAGFKC